LATMDRPFSPSSSIELFYGLRQGSEFIVWSYLLIP
jgi:hypothetical protein